MKLSIIIATRGRPELLKTTIENTLPHISSEKTRVLVCVDDDDQKTIDSLRFLPIDSRLTFSIKPREDSRGEKYDRALTEATADIYLPAVDCAPILTPGFDKTITSAATLFPDGIGCVYTPMVNASFPGLQAPTAKLVEKLGHIYSHEYPYWFIDHELDDIARMIGRYVCIDVDVSTAPMRPSKTIRMWDLAWWTVYFDMMTLERRLRARAIIDSVDFEEAQWRKAIMRDQYQPIEARSRWINGNVRANAVAIQNDRGEKGPPDEGYLRVKAKAEQKLQALYAAMRQAAA